MTGESTAGRTRSGSGASGSAERLRLGYRQCARLTWQYGTTYFWGAALLPREQRHHVYAVYALCRMADDIVDAPRATLEADRVPATRAALQEFQDRFLAAADAPEQAEPVLAAVGTTVRQARIDAECFDRFFGAMAQDLTQQSYRDWDDLLGYMEGSAAVIGEMMLPVLRPTSAAAREPARQLGFAFQLTNFLRDVDEDLDRGRVYLPQDELDRFGADPARRQVDDAWRALMAFQIERNRQLYRAADPGLDHLPGPSARCVGTARVLYSGILDRIERADYDVFSGRIRVPLPIKVATAAQGLVRIPRPRSDVGGRGAPSGTEHRDSSRRHGVSGHLDDESTNIMADRGPNG